MQEVFKIVLEALRKQAFSVMLLLAAVVSLAAYWHEEKLAMSAALATKETKYEADINELRTRNMACDEALRDALVRIARLEEKCNAFSYTKRR